MEARQKVDALLRKLLMKTTGRANLYYQPGANIRMKYPCIVYTMSRIQNKHANDGVYTQRVFYTVTVIDTDPDSKIVAVVSALPKCACDHQFISENLYHTVFRLYS